MNGVPEYIFLEQGLEISSMIFFAGGRQMIMIDNRGHGGRRNAKTQNPMFGFNCLNAVGVHMFRRSSERDS